jgi:hypothetical protein
VSQLLTILIAVAFAWQQSSAVKMFRDYVPVNNPHIGKYHKAGAIVAVLFCFDSSLLFFAHLLEYWVVFDIALNLFTGMKWHYVGETSKVDRWMRNNEVKAWEKVVICLGLILIFNLAHYGYYLK